MDAAALATSLAMSEFGKIPEACTLALRHGLSGYDCPKGLTQTFKFSIVRPPREGGRVFVCTMEPTM